MLVPLQLTVAVIMKMLSLLLLWDHVIFPTGYTFNFEEQNRINKSTIGIRNDYYTNSLELN